MKQIIFYQKSSAITSSLSLIWDGVACFCLYLRDFARLNRQWAG